MSSRRVISLVILFIFVGFSLGTISCCDRSVVHRSHRDVPESAKALAAASNTFTLDLYRELVKGNQANLAMSGLSVHAALTMTCLGARGETAEEMRKVLHLDSMQGNEAQIYEILQKALKDGASRNSHEFTMANALWADKRYSLKKSFESLIKRHFHGETCDVSFIDPDACEKARQRINDWTKDQTKGMIQALLKTGDLNSATMLVLSNAMYFHGNWALPFLREDTYEYPFTTLDSIRNDVPMMHLQFKDSRPGIERYPKNKTREEKTPPKPLPEPPCPLRGMQNDSLQMLEMPYRQNSASMLILLPRRYNGLPDLEKTLNAVLLDSFIRELDSLQKFGLAIPKFSLETNHHLPIALSALGMPRAFTPRADFRGIFEKDDGWIGEVIHGAKVEVDEQGTRAAAATHVFMVNCIPVFDFRFIADHPFLFLIRDNATGAILFAGRVTNPTVDK